MLAGCEAGGGGVQQVGLANESMEGHQGNQGLGPASGQSGCLRVPGNALLVPHGSVRGHPTEG